MNETEQKLHNIIISLLKRHKISCFEAKELHKIGREFVENSGKNRDKAVGVGKSNG